MTEAKPEWVKMKPAEVEKIVKELYMQGNTPSKIGLLLRDQHGIPRVKVMGKKIMHILKEAQQDVRSGKEEVHEKIKNLEKHLAHHRHDYTAKRSLNKNQWVARKKEKEKHV